MELSKTGGNKKHFNYNLPCRCYLDFKVLDMKKFKKCNFQEFLLSMATLAMTLKYLSYYVKWVDIKRQKFSML